MSFSARSLSSCGYTTFLMIKRSHSSKLCPTYDIDLAWHAHMTLLHEYQSDTEPLLGAVLPHDDSINDHSPDAELAILQKDRGCVYTLWGAAVPSAVACFGACLSVLIL